MLNNYVLNPYCKSSYLELRLNALEANISSLAFIIDFTFLLGMQDQFEVTLEATHHGPHVDLPACFVEIGVLQFCLSENIYKQLRITLLLTSTPS